MFFQPVNDTVLLHVLWLCQNTAVLMRALFVFTLSRTYSFICLQVCKNHKDIPRYINLIYQNKVKPEDIDQAGEQRECDKLLYCAHGT